MNLESYCCTKKVIPKELLPTNCWHVSTANEQHPKFIFLRNRAGKKTQQSPETTPDWNRNGASGKGKKFDVVINPILTFLVQISNSLSVCTEEVRKEVQWVSTAICKKWSVTATFYPMWGVLSKSMAIKVVWGFSPPSIWLAVAMWYWKRTTKNTGCMKRNDLISMCSLLPFSGNDRKVLLEGICKFQVVGSR